MSKKIVLRINNLEALANAPEPPAEKTEVIYHWPRIVGAGVAVCVLLGALGFGLYQWGQSEKILYPAVSVEPVTEAELAPALTASKAILAASEKQVPENGIEEPGADAEDSRRAMVAAEGAAVPAPQAVSSETAIVAEIIADANSSIQQATEAGAGKDENGKPSPLAESLVEEAQFEVEAAQQEFLSGESAPEEVAVSLPVTSAGWVSSSGKASIEVLSSLFPRVQLTSSVEEKEPVDELGDVLFMNEAGLLRVYLFTEVRAKVGQTLYHYWYRDGNRMARVRIPVGEEPTRVSSSKFINRDMLGPWKVEVQSEQGEVLARAQFRVQ